MTDTLPASSPDLPRRIAVTVAALAIYRIGSWIPLPGIDVTGLMSTFEVGSMASAIGRLSVMALGVTSWLSTLILAELAMIAAPPLRRWAEREENAASMQGWIVLVTLAMAGFQANGIAVALEGIGALVPAPGLAFRFGVIATLVSATACLVWVASLVSRFGLGSGFLLFLAAPILIDVPAIFATQALAWGPASPISLSLTLLLFAAATAALVFAAGAQTSAVATAQLLWPPLLAYAAAAWVPPLIALAVAPDLIEAAIELMKPGAPARILVIPALTFGFYVWRAHALDIDGALDRVAIFTGALVLALVVALFEGLPTFLPLPLVLDGRSVVIMVVFALSLLSTLGPANGSEPKRAP